MTSRSLGHRAPLLWLVLPMIAGLAVARLFALPPPGWLLAAASLTGVAALMASRSNRVATVPCLVATMLLAGAASYALHRPVIADWYALPPREARVSLRVDRLFPQPDGKRVTGLGMIRSAEEPLQELAGQRVYFSLHPRAGVPVPVRSAVVSAVGIIAALPRDPPATSFDGYLANAGVNFRLSRGRVLAEEKPGSAYHQFCARQAQRFTAMLGAGVESKQPELVGVYRAMLLGQQHELSDEQKIAFRQSGTMHVFSISGLHIAAIAGGLYAVLTLLRLPRLAQFVIGCVALWLYVDITGAAPSAVRAFVMVALVQASLVLRVPRNPLSALAASALAVTVFAPMQVFSSSFQMSYGIVLALLLLGLPLADQLHARLAWFRDLPRATWRWHHRWRAAAWHATLTATAIGLAASLVSAVTGIMFFGLFTPGSLLANLWLIPAASAVILAGFVSLVCGLVGFTAGSLLANHAAVLLLWGINAGVNAFVSLPGAWFNATFRAPWLGGCALAALLGVIVSGYAARWAGWQRGYWLPFATLAATLALAVRFG